jgi:hypothetical protein
MTYKVTQQFTGARESVLERFSRLDDAKKKARQEAEKNAEMRINAIYRIYEFEDDLVETIDSSKLTIPPAAASESNDTAGGQSQGATFKPTPFEMAPRPPGTAPRVWVEPDEKDKDKDR